MSLSDDNSSIAGTEANDHQPAYIFTLPSLDDAPEPSPKRRKIAKGKITSITESTPPSVRKDTQLFGFEPLFNGLEGAEYVTLRQDLFERYWGETDQKIQSILNKANEDTYVKVASFVQETEQPKGTGQLPTGFIATGPNIASQDLLFQLLASHLRSETNDPVINLRSGDTSNLKAVLKQVIRDATNQKSTGDDDELSAEQDGRKYLNYDLEILYGHVKAYKCNKVIVAFQDSEAFDPTILADLIILFNSWRDRIPFVLLFGIATSVELFHERLPRAASRCLYGAQFDVEQTSTILETIFQRVVASPTSPLMLGPRLLSALLDRQNDHIQSVQAFTTALKYAYMCHFYANPLSVLNDNTKLAEESVDMLQSQHLRAVKMLPSFRHTVEELLIRGEGAHARGLLEDEEVLQDEMKSYLTSKQTDLTILLRKMHILAIAANGSTGKIELYLNALKGTLSDSDLVRGVLESIKRMAPEAAISFTDRILTAMETGCLESDLDSWIDDDSEFVGEIVDIREEAATLLAESERSGNPIRSSYSIHSKGLRTTVIAQKLQLSYEKSSLSKQDIQFTSLIDKLSLTLESYFVFNNPRDTFLNEAWIYDSLSPYKDVFTPRPRFAIERALSTPSDYLPGCDPQVGALPPTAIVYQMYLESGNLVNVSDIWEAFLSHVGGEDGEGYDERTALMLLYKGLADLKGLGMVKLSKKKADHLTKSAWKGL